MKISVDMDLCHLDTRSSRRTRWALYVEIEFTDEEKTAVETAGLLDFPLCPYRVCNLKSADRLFIRRHWSGSDLKMLLSDVVIYGAYRDSRAPRFPDKTSTMQAMAELIANLKVLAARIDAPLIDGNLIRPC